MAHITGGGIPGNLNRVLPTACDALLQRRSWEVPPIFGEIQRLGSVSDEEMGRVFNMGLGMIVAVPPDDAFRTIDVLRGKGHRAAQVGEIVPGGGFVRIT